MKGFGCDDDAIIEIICKRNNQQRQDIQKVFKTNFGKDLIENIKSETRGNFEDIMVALLTPILDFYCKEIHDALSGIGTDESCLIEILCTLSNYEIETIKVHYNRVYGQDLESAIIGDTSGNFKRLLVSLCCANRDESGSTDIDQAKADATALLRAGELMFGTDESVFNSILCQKNYNQLRLIFQEYETMTGHSFEQAIKNEFSGDVKEGFKAIFRCVNNKAEFFAHQLMKSMKGIGEFASDRIEKVSLIALPFHFRHERSSAYPADHNTLRNRHGRDQGRLPATFQRKPPRVHQRGHFGLVQKIALHSHRRKKQFVSTAAAIKHRFKTVQELYASRQATAV